MYAKNSGHKVREPIFMPEDQLDVQAFGSHFPSRSAERAVLMNVAVEDEFDDIGDLSDRYSIVHDGKLAAEWEPSNVR